MIEIIANDIFLFVQPKLVISIPKKITKMKFYIKIKLKKYLKIK